MSFSLRNRLIVAYNDYISALKESWSYYLKGHSVEKYEGMVALQQGLKDHKLNENNLLDLLERVLNSDTNPQSKQHAFFIQVKIEYLIDQLEKLNEKISSNFEILSRKVAAYKDYETAEQARKALVENYKLFKEYSDILKTIAENDIQHCQTFIFGRYQSIQRMVPVVDNLYEDYLKQGLKVSLGLMKNTNEEIVGDLKAALDLTDDRAISNEEAETIKKKVESIKPKLAKFSEFVYSTYVPTTAVTSLTALQKELETYDRDITSKIVAECHEILKSKKDPHDKLQTLQALSHSLQSSYSVDIARLNITTEEKEIFKTLDEQVRSDYSYEQKLKAIETYSLQLFKKHDPGILLTIPGKSPIRAEAKGHEDEAQFISKQIAAITKYKEMLKIKHIYEQRNAIVTKFTQYVHEGQSTEAKQMETYKASIKRYNDYIQGIKERLIKEKKINEVISALNELRNTEQSFYQSIAKFNIRYRTRINCEFANRSNKVDLNNPVALNVLEYHALLNIFHGLAQSQARLIGTISNRFPHIYQNTGLVGSNIITDDLLANTTPFDAVKNLDKHSLSKVVKELESILSSEEFKKYYDELCELVLAFESIQNDFPKTFEKLMSIHPIVSGKSDTTTNLVDEIIARCLQRTAKYTEQLINIIKLLKNLGDIDPSNLENIYIELAAIPTKRYDITVIATNLERNIDARLSLAYDLLAQIKRNSNDEQKSAELIERAKDVFSELGLYYKEYEKLIEANPNKLKDCVSKKANYEANLFEIKNLLFTSRQSSFVRSFSTILSRPVSPTSANKLENRKSVQALYPDNVQSEDNYITRGYFK